MVFVEMLIKFLEFAFWVTLFNGLVFSFFWFARAGWERKHDKNPTCINNNIDKAEIKYHNCTIQNTGEKHEPKAD